MSDTTSVERDEREAREAWRLETQRLVSPTPRDALLAVVMATGVVACSLVAWRAAVEADTPWTGSFGVMAVVALIAALVSVARLTRRRIHADVRRVRERVHPGRCPRCGGAPDVERRVCAACGARLRLAEGLVVVHLEDDRQRRTRWHTAARHQLRHVRATVALSPPLWLGAVVTTLAIIVGAAHVFGGGLGVVAPVAASVGEPLEIPDNGVARARGSAAEDLVLGEPTRPRAPLLVGTQVLARMGHGPYHELAVIVRVRERHAFVVYADGDSAWVDADAMMAPEIAVADAVEVFDGARFVPGIVRARLGSALLVDGAWNDVSQMRVRGDGEHVEREGRTSEVPPEAWVEARVGDSWRPGVSVASVELRQRVVLGHGSERWFEPDSIREQRLGPGARVLVDGRVQEQIVAARIGHALAIVGPDGVRSWTALARVWRPVAAQR